MEYNICNLTGEVLNGKWKITSKLRDSTSTSYSIHYLAEYNSSQYFVKVYDFSAFQNYVSRDKGITDIFGDFFDMYNHEKRISEECLTHKISNIVTILDHGTIGDQGNPGTIIPYLVYTKADSSVDEYLNTSETVSLEWKAYSLHNIAKGLNQLHKKRIFHNHITPNRILKFGEDSRLGGLGKSHSNIYGNPLSASPLFNNPGYTSPDLLYDYQTQDLTLKKIAIDNYMLGSLVLYYYTHASMTGMLLKTLPDELHWKNYSGSYEDILPHLTNAFSTSLEVLLNESEVLHIDRIVELIEMLCQPNLEKRGAGRRYFHKIGNPFALDHILTKLDVLRKAYRVSVGKHGN